MKTIIVYSFLSSLGSSRKVSIFLAGKKNYLKFLISNYLYIPSYFTQGSTNCAHGDERVPNTKLRARKSIKTPLSSIPMLFKVASCFCV